MSVADANGIDWPKVYILRLQNLEDDNLYSAANWFLNWCNVIDLTAASDVPVRI